MGSVFCCEWKGNKNINFKINEGESFIREVFSKTNLSKYTIIELHKYLVNKELLDFEEINEACYHIDVTNYSNISVTYLYDKDPINKYNQIHSILFSFIASSFQQSLTRINGLGLLKTFLVFCKSSLAEKVKYYISFSRRRLFCANVKDSLRACLLDHLKFLIRGISYEMSILVFNEGKQYMDNLNSMNALCKVCNEDQIEKFLNDNVLGDVEFSNIHISNTASVEKELTDFLMTKPFLFDFNQLRDVYFSLYLK